ncbi:MAG: class II fructose-bisphosphate aldolase [Clostridia bacterium]|nr:class II fructose-bisphosphate aldolase [Clostridia bacterium]
MLVTLKEIVDHAYANHYAVPAVGAGDESQIRAVLEAAEDANAPVIMLGGRATRAVFDHADPAYFGYMFHDLANQVDVPVALCLDHSPTFEDAVRGIRNGYTGIMVDRSMLPYEENVAKVKELVRIAAAAGVSVEAEIGHVGRGANYAVDGTAMLTDPQQAKQFIEETGIDALAVAIGTAHGQYVGTPKLHFDRLEAINEACKFPLVLHGGSGTGDDNIHKACTMGISKVNIVTDLWKATVRALEEADLTGGNIYDVYRYAYNGYKKQVAYSFELTGAVGKAWRKERRLPRFVPYQKPQK